VCKTGEKDAVEERDGLDFIVPRGIDTSFLVATLVASVQEQPGCQWLIYRLD